jgi:copper chaperone
MIACQQYLQNLLIFPLTLQRTRESRMKRLNHRQMRLMTLQLKIPNMACSACGDAIAEAIKAIDSTATVQADPETKLVSIETQSPETAIKQAISEAGYSVA